MSQTEYNIEPDVAEAGLYSMSYEPSIRSYNTPVDTIPYGRGVAQVSGDTDGVELVDGASADFLGVAIRRLITDTDDELQYEALESVGVLNDGYVWVPTEESVAVGDDVYVRHSASAQVQTMTFDADFVTSNTIVLDETARTVVMTASVNGEAGEFDVENITVAGGASQANGTVAETFPSTEEADKGKFGNSSANSTRLQVTGARWLDYDSGTSLGLLSLKNA